MSSSSTLLPAEFVETAAVDMIRSASPTLVGNEDLQKNKSTEKLPFIIVDILKPNQTSYAFNYLLPSFAILKNFVAKRRA